MNRRDYDYLISCAARVEADAEVGKTSFSNTSDKCLINAFICGALWFFIHSNIIFSRNCDVRVDDYLVSFIIGLLVSVFLGLFLTNKYIEKTQSEWLRQRDFYLADLKKRIDL